jgi:hypothetical protein
MGMNNDFTHRNTLMCQEQFRIAYFCTLRSGRDGRTGVTLGGMNCAHIKDFHAGCSG